MKRILLGVALVAALVVGIGGAAAEGRDLELIPGCTSYSVEDGSLIGTRDNTGRAAEAFVVRVRDGRGELVYDLVIEVPLRGRYDFDEGARFRYPLPVRANPLTAQVISLSGNGQAALTLYSTTAACPTLPGAQTDALLAADPYRLPRLTNPPGAAEANAAYGIVNTDNLNLRAGDSAAYTRLAVLDGGTTLILLGTNGETDEAAIWWYVEVGGVRGWVKNEFIIIRGDTSGLDTVTTRGALALPYFILGADNFLRTVPSPGASILCILPANINYPVLAKDAEDASWYRVEGVCSGVPTIGWVQAEAGFLRADSDRAIPTP